MNPRGNDQHDQQTQKTSEFIRTSSMTTLIMWNIKKALEANPKLELKSGLKSAQESLDKEQVNVSAIVLLRPDERHLSCALLAWQQLGHRRADSLYSFAMTQMKVDTKPLANKCGSWGTFGVTKKKSFNVPIKSSFITHKESELVESPVPSGIIGPSGTASFAMGPVLKLPNTPKNVIPVYNVQAGCGLRKTGQDIKKKIEKACCLESSCVERLKTIDDETKGLRQRLGQLAKREKDRIELLESAESAWRELEMGYKRRHRACIEKEEDILRQSSKLIEQRNNNKECCSKLVVVLKPRGETAEQARVALKHLETRVCAAACNRLNMSEAAHKETTILTELQCKSNQQDRDLMFKEEQARRKKSTAQNELESTRGLLYEEERTLKAELKGFKEQLKDVSKELFEEDAIIEKIKKERDELLQEKREITEDLEGCQDKCDKYMQKRVDELKAKREEFKALKEKVLDCKCKFPMEAGVQVQRTPSLAALCCCQPQDRALRSCSCTSLRSSLLSDLFKSLFAGLKTEMGETSIRMPCQLLKCLEDNHSWDRTTVTKTNLRSFFAKLLCGELEIAIINSIENYHAQWIGASCADFGRPIPDLDSTGKENWEERALAEKAHWMAQSMAEEMFKERVDGIMEQAKKVVSAGPPPCTCKPPQTEKNAAVYQCLIEPINHTRIPVTSSIDVIPERDTMPAEREIVSVSTNTPKKNFQTARSPQKNEILRKVSPNRPRSCYECSKSDVVLLRAQIESLKRESLKKQDMKFLEQTIKLLVQRGSGPDEPPELQRSAVNNPPTGKNRLTLNSKLNKNNNMKTKKKKICESVFEKMKINRQFAVNMCICGLDRSMTKSDKEQSIKISNEGNMNSKQKASKNTLSVISSKPSHLTENMPLEENKTSKTNESKIMTCGSNCGCFNKMPSCTSIENFLETLTKWKRDLNGCSAEAGNVLVESEYNSKQNAAYEKNNNDISTLVYHSTVSTDDTKKFGELNKSDIICELEYDHEYGEKYRLPTTESEYMGAVNLEKSNEHICKSFISNKENLQNKVEHKNDKRGSFCECKVKVSADKRKVKSEECARRKKELTNQKKIRDQEVKNKKNMEIFTQNNIITSKASLSTKLLAQNNMKREISKPVPSLLLGENYTQNEVIKEETTKKKSLFPVDKNNNKIETDTPKTCQDNRQDSFNFSMRDRGLNTSDDLKCRCEHQIKLLGVTLVNGSMEKEHTNKYVGVTERNKYPLHPKQDGNRENNMTSSLFSYPVKSMENYNLFKSEKTGISSLKMPLCQCSVKLDKLKILLDNSNLDKKTFITNSIKDVHPDDNCVCCKNLVEDSNELEINTFHLLQEHLKKKLNILKNTSKSSYCINPNEEDKIVSKIFKKIKQVITESTGKITCKCAEDTDNESSWQRAYNLLQEYLKIKISRVQCSCSEPDQNNEQTILPQLTDKVCLLIEKDFERLKDICKNKHEQKSASEKMSFIENIKIQSPEKDTDENKSQKVNNGNIKQDLKDEEFSKSYVILTCNTSAQVIPLFSTKSCETLKMAELIDTQEKVSSKINYVNSKVLVENLIPNIETRSWENMISIDQGRGKSETQISVKDSPKIFSAEYLPETKTSQSTQYTTGSENDLTGTLLEKPADILSKFKELEVELKSRKDPCEKSNTISWPYIGYTINCNCTPNLGFCICSRSKVIENSDFINNLWLTCTKSKTSNLNTSYMMENINRTKKEPCNICGNYLPKYASEHVIKTDIDTNTRRNVIFTLRVSAENVNKQCKQSGTNTDDKNILRLKPKVGIIESCNEPEPLKTHKKKSVHFLHRSKSEVIAKDTEQKSASNYPECDCSKVPVCHVKMLVNDIELKLANLECTCDSLSSKVCPVHSKIEG